MPKTHLRCDACHAWRVEGDNHARSCVPVAPALAGETLCERCDGSFPAEALFMDFCQPCQDAIARVCAGDFSDYGL